MPSSTKQDISISAFIREVNISPISRYYFTQKPQYKSSSYWSKRGKRRKWIFQYSTGVLFLPLQYIQFRCIWKVGEKKEVTYQKLSNKTSCLSFISPDGQTTWLHLKATQQIKVLGCAFCCSFYISEVYSLWRSNTMMTWPARISTSLKPEWRICLCRVSGQQPSMLVQQQPHYVWPTRSLTLAGFIKGCFPFSSVFEKQLMESLQARVSPLRMEVGHIQPLLLNEADLHLFLR